jgi:hypothetical protein
MIVLIYVNTSKQVGDPVSLALANGSIRNQNSLFEQNLMPGRRALSLSGCATT